MKLTPEEFEKKLKEIMDSTVKETIQPMLAGREAEMKELEGRIEAKIKDIVSQIGEKAPVITGGHDRAEMDTKGGFKSFGHFCHDVIKASGGPYGVSRELTDYVKRVETKAALTGLATNDNEHGSYVIPTQFSNELLIAIEEKNEILPRCLTIPTTSNALEIPAVNGYDLSGGLVFGGVTWYWTDEEGLLAESRPKFQKIGMKLKKITGLAGVSDEMIADSPVSMDAFLRRAFESGLNYQYNRALIRGTGSGQPLGCLNAPCLVTVDKESGQTAGTILYENVLNAYSRLYDKSNVIVLANPDTLPQLATMAISGAAAMYPVFLPAGGASGKPYNTLMGLPLIFSDHCAAVGTVGDLIFADWSQYLILRKSGGDISSFDTSIHVQFLYGQQTFRFQMRFDGQPWWSTFYTPPISTTKTRSPFVVIQSR